MRGTGQPLGGGVVDEAARLGGRSPGHRDLGEPVGQVGGVVGLQIGPPRPVWVR